MFHTLILIAPVYTYKLGGEENIEMGDGNDKKLKEGKSIKNRKISFRYKFYIILFVYSI